MLTAVIVDDEYHARENLRTMLLSDHKKEVNVLAVSEGGIDAIEKIKTLKPDLLFLDIEMPIISGFELLKAFPNPSFSLVIVTAHSKYGMPAVNASAQYFLNKPIENTLLEKAIQKVIHQRILFKDNELQIKMNQRSIRNMIQDSESKEYPLFLTLEINSSKHIIFLDDLRYLMADDNYVQFHMMDDTSYTDYGLLGQFEKILDPKKFTRIHRSYLINLSHVKTIYKEPKEVEMLGGSILSISRRKYKDFSNAYEAYLKR